MGCIAIPLKFLNMKELEKQTIPSDFCGGGKIKHTLRSQDP